MFAYFKVKKAYRRSVDQIIVPGADNFSDNRTVSEYKNGKPQRMLLRVSVCLFAMAVLAGIGAAYRQGYLSRNPVTASLSQENQTEMREVSPNQFMLVAYAAAETAGKSSSASMDASSAGSVSESIQPGSRTVLQQDVSVALPMGRIERHDYGVSTEIDGHPIYSYSWPANPIFHFEGENIRSIEISAARGSLFALGSKPDGFGDPYPPGKAVTMAADEYVKWVLYYKDIATIIKDPDFTDFSSIPTDTVTILIHFQDGSTQHHIVTMSFNQNGYLVSKLR